MSVEKVVKGEPLIIKAQEWNSISDVVKWAEDRQRTLGVPGALEKLSQVEIYVSNKVGEDLDYGNIVVITGISLTPDTDAEKELFSASIPVFEADLYENLTDAEIPLTPVGVVLEGLEDDEVGRCLLYGVQPVRINISDEDHFFARPVEDDKTRWESSPVGPVKIIWKEGGTGDNKYAVIWLQKMPWINSEPENPYIIDRRTAADDMKEWNPLLDLPADWKDYDGVRFITRVLRYTSGAGAKLEYVDETKEWITEYAPVISAVSVSTADTSECPE